MKTKLITIVEFEDHGQDFLKWEVDSQHKIIGCSPSQGSVWLGRRCDIYNHPSTGRMSTMLDRGDCIKYPVIKVTTRPSKFVVIKHGKQSGMRTYRTKTDGWSKHFKNAEVWADYEKALAKSSSLFGQNTEVLEL